MSGSLFFAVGIFAMDRLVGDTMFPDTSEKMIVLIVKYNIFGANFSDLSTGLKEFWGWI